MGNVSELSGGLDFIFDLVGAKKVGGMVDAGGNRLEWVPPPPRTSNNIWTVLRPDPVDDRDATVSLMQFACLNGQQ